MNDPHYIEVNGLLVPEPHAEIPPEPERASAEDEFPSLAQFKTRLEPYGWVQWKGTDVCMDVHCTCGALLHLDADFAYHVQCPHCLQYYECSGFIDLIPLDFRPTNPILMDKDDELDEMEPKT